MPWTPKDALRHTKKATTAVAQRQWAAVANGELKKHGDEGRAVRMANSVIGLRSRKAPKKRRTKA